MVSEPAWTSSGLCHRPSMVGTRLAAVGILVGCAGLVKRLHRSPAARVGGVERRHNPGHSDTAKDAETRLCVIAAGGDVRRCRMSVASTRRSDSIFPVTQPSGLLDLVGGTKGEQQATGREAARRDGVEHIIKKKDGTIGENNSYGYDPRQTMGRRRDEGRSGVRIWSYNVENLFARAKAMNLDWSAGGPILKAQGEVNSLLQADVYTDPIKKEILRLLGELRLTKTDESAFVRSSGPGRDRCRSSPLGAPTGSAGSS